MVRPEADMVVTLLCAILDGGLAVALWAVPLLIIQGALTMGAETLAPYLTPAVESFVSATGGILILGIGVNLLALRLPVPISSVWPKMIFSGRSCRWPSAEAALPASLAASFPFPVPRPSFRPYARRLGPIWAGTRRPGSSGRPAQTKEAPLPLVKAGDSCM
jgi:hypothetical protein